MINPWVFEHSLVTSYDWTRCSPPGTFIPEFQLGLAWHSHQPAAEISHSNHDHHGLLPSPITHHHQSPLSLASQDSKHRRTTVLRSHQFHKKTIATPRNVCVVAQTFLVFTPGTLWFLPQLGSNQSFHDWWVFLYLVYFVWVTLPFHFSHLVFTLPTPQLSPETLDVAREINSPFVPWSPVKLYAMWMRRWTNLVWIGLRFCMCFKSRNKELGAVSFWSSHIFLDYIMEK